MRISSGVILLAFVLACGRGALAQDIGQTVLLNQTTMQGVQNTNHPSVQIVRPSSQPTAQRPTTFENIESYPAQPFPDCGCARQPYFPVHAGEVARGTQVTITSPIPGAMIYYTTDGWTPTHASLPYTGPIPINADTRLQAIAEEPNKLPSAIVEMLYTVSGPAALPPTRAIAIDGILRKDTPLRLVTSAYVSSDSAQTGDRMILLLDENVMAGTSIVAAKGTPVAATITRVDPAGPGGKPGVIAFQVQPLNANGVAIPLRADLTLSAPDLAAQAQKIADPALVHVTSAPPPGQEAEIEPGMPLTALVSADISLQ
jgi:hypothetical protein